jgi:hypothetical protein
MGKKIKGPGTILKQEKKGCQQIFQDLPEIFADIFRWEKGYEIMESYYQDAAEQWQLDHSFDDIYRCYRRNRKVNDFTSFLKAEVKKTYTEYINSAIADSGIDIGDVDLGKDEDDEDYYGE